MKKALLTQHTKVCHKPERYPEGYLERIEIVLAKRKQRDAKLWHWRESYRAAI